MGNTYSVNDDLVLDTGQSVDDFLANTLTALQKIQMKEKARQRAFNFINDSNLRGRTVIPAFHIPQMKQIEIDLVIADLMTGAYVLETANTSEWTVKYETRAQKALEGLRFSASAEVAIADRENTGNGKITSIEVVDEFTRTETWILRATSATTFSIRGTVTGYLPEATVGVWFPEKDWDRSFNDYDFPPNASMLFEEFPIRLKITAGLVAFVDDDKFIFRTYSASYFRQMVGSITLA